MAKYAVNDEAVEFALELIAKRRYVLESRWGDVQPSASQENAYLEDHSWDEYARWHLGLTDGANDGTKARYAFVFGDFQPHPPDGHHRLSLPCCGVAAQGDRAGGALPPAGARQRVAADPFSPGRGALPPRAWMRTSAPALSLDGTWAFRLAGGAWDELRCPRTGSCTATARPPTRTSPIRSPSIRRGCPTRTRPGSTGAASRSRPAGRGATRCCASAARTRTCGRG